MTHAPGRQENKTREQPDANLGRERLPASPSREGLRTGHEAASGPEVVRRHTRLVATRDKRARHVDSEAAAKLFRPMTPTGLGLARRHLDRKTPWRLVKKYCEAAGIDPERLGGRGIGIHSLRKTAINDAIRNGATMHEVREFAGHADIRTTEVYFVRKEEDAEVAARRIQIRITGRRSE
jgi:integrase